MASRIEEGPAKTIIWHRGNQDTLLGRLLNLVQDNCAWPNTAEAEEKAEKMIWAAPLEELKEAYHLGMLDKCRCKTVGDCIYCWSTDFASFVRGEIIAAYICKKGKKMARE